ncbi:MAG: cytochrome c oxidase subunit II [Bacteroidales bacterium]|nr:cytochrome c oxidase subunit II [Bacteroidales bacterium]
MYSINPENASNFVAGVDLAFFIILGVSIFFLVAITAAMIIFIRKYNREKHPEAIQNEGSTKLEIIWTVIPLLIVLVMFYFGWMGWKPMKTPPEDAMRVKAIARMWNFKFEYENGKLTDSLYVPLNQPVILDLVALDVLHSLYIPAFRVKEDMVPGNIKQMWFIPGQVGSYDLFCTEYCGLEHSYMYTGVHVMHEDEFDEWLKDTTAVAPVVAEDASPADRGFQVLVKNGCNACHSSDGSKLVGPSYLGNWGNMRKVTAGGEKTEVLFDKEYIRKSIYDPNAEIADGFNKGLMLSYEGLVSEEEIELIIEYIRSLNE